MVSVYSRSHQLSLVTGVTHCIVDRLEAVTNENTDTDATQTPFHTLAEKLDGLDLTAQEEQALGVLLRAEGSTGDVEGFGWDEGVAAVMGNQRLRVRGFNIGMPPSLGISAELGAGHVVDHKADD